MAEQNLSSPRPLTPWEAATVAKMTPPPWRIDVSQLRVFRERDDGSVWFASQMEEHELVAHGEAHVDDDEGVGVLLFGTPARRTICMLELERDDRPPASAPSEVTLVWQFSEDG
jgi:hypothetical protein